MRKHRQHLYFRLLLPLVLLTQLLSLRDVHAAAANYPDEKTVLLYSGASISQLCVASFESCLKQRNTRVEKMCDAESLSKRLQIANSLAESEHKKIVIIIPGGHTGAIVAELYSFDQSSKCPLKLMRNLIENGASYLGSCAGANLACRNLFDATSPWNHSKEASSYLLNLAPINAYYFSHPRKGALRREFRDEERLSELAESITKPEETGRYVGYRSGLLRSESASKAAKCFWSDGSYFDTDAARELSIVASFDETADAPNAPCVVFGRYGKGSFVLSTIHPELQPDVTTLCPIAAAQLKFKDVTDVDLNACKVLLEQMFDLLELPKLRAADSADSSAPACEKLSKTC